MHGDLCCHPALEWAPSRIIQLSRSDIRISADTSTVPGNWEASPQEDSLANPRIPIRTMGHQCENQRFGRGRSGDARVTSALWLPPNAGFANGVFIMTTATDQKNDLNSSALKKKYARTLRVETIANSAGGTAEVAIVAQPSAGFLNTSSIQMDHRRKTPKTA